MTVYGGQDSIELGFQKSLQLEFDVYMEQQVMYGPTNWQMKHINPATKLDLGHELNNVGSEIKLYKS